jgi:subtilisin family serine protease
MTDLKKLRRRLTCGVIALGVLAGAPAFAAAKKIGPNIAPGQARYIVEYNAGNRQAIVDFVAANGGKVVYDYSALINGMALDLSPNARNSLRSSGLVKTIVDDEIRALHDPVKKNIEADGGFAAPNALPAGFPTGSFSEFVPWGRDRVNADAVWSIGPNLGVADNGVAAPDVAPGTVTGQGVVVGVLDTGVDYNHPDLAANLIDDRGDATIRNFLEMLPGAEDLTFNGHGTSVSSVIASVDNEVGVIGVAPGAKIRPYRVCDGGCPLSAIIAGLTQATLDGVDVINMSYGGGAGFNIEASLLQLASLRDIVLVASAGNDGDQKIQFPAGYGQVIAVGATDINDNPATFTNFGGWVDITGPGVDNPTATCNGCVTAGIVEEISPTARNFQSLGMTNSPIAAVSGKEIVYIGRGCNVSGGDTLLADPNGKIALIERGLCTFAEKVAFAENNGAVATIVHNDARAVLFGGTLGDFFSAGPSVSLSQADGLALRQDMTLGPVIGNVGVVRTNQQYWFISGTSFSSPHVAGVAALARSANPNLNAQQVGKVLTTTAEPFGNQNLFGAGMVRADRAVQAAQP